MLQPSTSPHWDSFLAAAQVAVRFVVVVVMVVLGKQLSSPYSTSRATARL